MWQNIPETRKYLITKEGLVSGNDHMDIFQGRPMWDTLGQSAQKTPAATAIASHHWTGPRVLRLVAFVPLLPCSLSLSMPLLVSLFCFQSRFLSLSIYLYLSPSLCLYLSISRSWLSHVFTFYSLTFLFSLSLLLVLRIFPVSLSLYKESAPITLSLSWQGRIPCLST